MNNNNLQLRYIFPTREASPFKHADKYHQVPNQHLQEFGKPMNKSTTVERDSKLN